jgi:hypothetical protein
MTASGKRTYIVQNVKSYFAITPPIMSVADEKVAVCVDQQRLGKLPFIYFGVRIDAPVSFKSHEYARANNRTKAKMNSHNEEFSNQDRA